MNSEKFDSEIAAVQTDFARWLFKELDKLYPKVKIYTLSKAFGDKLIIRIVYMRQGVREVCLYRVNYGLNFRFEHSRHKVLRKIIKHTNNLRD